LKLSDVFALGAAAVPYFRERRYTERWTSCTQWVADSVSSRNYDLTCQS